MLKRPLLPFAAAALVLTGCVSTNPAPVVDREPPSRTAGAAAPRVPVARTDAYVVKPGDTLFSIAQTHGVDYRQLAIWNGIDNPAGLRVGQQLRLQPASVPTVAAPATPSVVPPQSDVAVTAPLKTYEGGVEARPLGTEPLATPLPGTKVAAGSAPRPAAAGAPLITEPQAQRLPYSEQALAQLSKESAGAAPPPPVSARPEPAKPEAPARTDPPARTEPPARAEAPEVAKGPEDLDWAWPVKGKVVGSFNDASSKGIAIAGRMGQPVVASAPGRVIFSGTGIRGFGKLIVIKHNATYLSVYAHNSELNVKEGQNVSRGQKIAEMGNSDADQVKLHFEIRRLGKPVDPMKLLPGG